MRRFSSLPVIGSRSCLVLVLLFLAALAPHAAAAAEPAAVIKSFHATLLAVMKNADKLGVNGRYDLLAPVIDKDFDLQRTVRVAVGKFWRSADGAARTKVLASFRRLSIATYAAQFDGWSGQAFTTIASRPGPQGTILVQTKITSPGGNDAALTYVLKERARGNGDWRIVDVLLDGSISQLAVRRSEYQRVLKSGGIKGLIKV
ncbi:MAG TPA: toluene tolerance protein, partial [Alphaproteobacteria bacterium]|nr:toluene tolerance protein [Alphaproteobacteria bacterium]